MIDTTIVQEGVKFLPNHSLEMAHKFYITIIGDVLWYSMQLYNFSKEDIGNINSVGSLPTWDEICYL